MKRLSLLITALAYCFSAVLWAQATDVERTLKAKYPYVDADGYMHVYVLENIKGVKPMIYTITDENGAFTLDVTRIEVMGRDISVVASHEKSQNVDIRAIIDAENMALLNGKTVKFGLKPKKVYVFEKNTRQTERRY